MGLTRIAIQRPLFITMVVLAMVLMGLVSYGRLGMDLFPSINTPVATITTVYPGASPEDVARLITKPIEDAVAGISDLDTLTSTSAEGRSVVTATFKDTANADTVSGEVERRVSAVRSQLPTDALSPSVQKIDVAAQPIIYLAVSGDAGLDAIYRYADEKLRPQLESVGGVGSVDIGGGLKRELRVQINPTRLRAYGVSLDQVNAALARENQGTPGGTLETAQRTTDVRLSGLFKSAEDIRNAPIVTTERGTIRIGDVATVEDTFKKVDRITRVNGHPGVLMTISKQGTANAVSVGAAIDKVLKQEQGALPPGMELTKVVDSTIYTKNSIQGVFITLGEACMLTALVLLLFLHTVRSTIIVLIAIPTSLITTLFAMYVMGFSLNVMSTLGLTLVIGVLVDDSIVVLENIFRHLELGETPWTAALNGRSEIGLAAITITLVDVVVFAPVGFLTGAVGQYFRQFALTIVVSTLLSLFVSFTLTPMLASRWLNRDVIHIGGGPWGWFSRQFERFFSALERGYRHVLAWVISPSRFGGPFRFMFNHRWVPVTLAMLSLVGAVGLLAVGFVKFEFIPNTDQGRFFVYVEMPPGSSINATDEVMRRIEDRLAEVPEVEQTVTSVGRGSPNALGLFQIGGRFAQSIVNVADKKHRTRSTDDIIKDIRPDIIALAGSNATVRVEGANAGGGGQPISIRLSGDDRATLQQLSAQVEQAVRDAKGTRDVINSEGAVTPEARLVPDRARLADFGLSAQQASNALRTAVEGVVPTKLRPEDANEVDIRLIGDEPMRTNLNAVMEMPLTTPNGQIVTLGQVTRVETGTSTAAVSRQNRQRAIIVSAGLEPNVTLGEATQGIQRNLQSVTIPAGYKLEFTGQVQSQQEGFRDLTFALMLSLLLIFMLMVALNESLTLPFVNMFALPVSLVGAFVGLAVGRESLNILSMIGLIFLMGLVAKNGILLVDYINTLRKRGLSRTEAILQAGPTRLRPIVMTTMALVLGLLPLALKLEEGAELRAGIGWIIIGGMLSSTLLSLILIPTVYTLVDDVQNFVGGLFRRRPAAVVAAPRAGFDPAAGLAELPPVQVSAADGNGNGRHAHPAGAAAGAPVREPVGAGAGDRGRGDLI